MKYEDLKDYHAYYVMVVVFLASCLLFKDMVFFPLACCMACLGFVRQMKDQGKLASKTHDQTGSQ